MIKLFLSHASEDKEDFVRPLAEALRKDFDVWYDEYELLLGDSLLKKITDGLKNCDYGVVVLSPHFFSKKWTGSELDGLFNLETTERKVILPIWKDVTVDDVKEFSPMLAGRLGVTVDSGIEKIIQEIKRAVGIFERGKELQKTSWKKKFSSIAEDLEYKKRVTDLSHSTRGVEQVTESARTVLARASDRAFDLSRSQPELNIRVVTDQFRPNYLLIRIFGVLALRFQFWAVYSNSTADSTLEVASFKDHGSFHGYEQGLIDSATLQPKFNRDLKVYWEGASQKFSSEEDVLDFAFDMLAKAVEDFLQRRQAQ